MPGAVIGAAVGGVISSKASDKAAKTQAAAADRATEVQKEMFDQTREDLAPFREGGYAANNALLYRMGLGGIDRDAIKADLRAKNPQLFGSGEQGSGQTLASTDAGLETMGRMFVSQPSAPGAGTLSDRLRPVQQYLTPEDFVTVGRFANLPDEERYKQTSGYGKEADAVREIFNKYRRSS